MMQEKKTKEKLATNGFSCIAIFLTNKDLKQILGSVSKFVFSFLLVLAET